MKLIRQLQLNIALSKVLLYNALTGRKEHIVMADEQKNMEDIFANDSKYQEGLNVYRDLEKKAHDKSNELAQQLIEQVIKQEDKFNLSTALMAVSKTLTHLASYLYDTEEEFLSAVQKARTSVVTDVVPALLNPTPCGKCQACKNGNPMECINPEVRTDYTETRFLPILANMLLEYDIFNKVLHMYALRDENKKSDENSMGPNNDPKPESSGKNENSSS